MNPSPFNQLSYQQRGAGISVSLPDLHHFALPTVGNVLILSWTITGNFDEQLVVDLGAPVIVCHFY